MEILSELQYDIFLQFEIYARVLSQESMKCSCVLGYTHTCMRLRGHRNI